MLNCQPNFQNHNRVRHTNVIAGLYCMANNNPTYLNYRESSIVDYIIISEEVVQPVGGNEACIGQIVTSDHIPLMVNTTIGSSRLSS